MAIGTYALGNILRVSGVFKNMAGTLVDPALIKFKFKYSGASTVEYTYGVDAQIIKDSIGNYHVDLDLSVSGNWHYRFYSTGSGQAASEGQFVVDIPEI